jgi:hypothetical protein
MSATPFSIEALDDSVESSTARANHLQGLFGLAHRLPPSVPSVGRFVNYACSIFSKELFMVAQVVREDVQIVEEHLGGLWGTRSIARDAWVFLAGAEAFHTLSHVWLGLSGMLPMEIQFPPMTVTRGLNVFAIVVNALITVGFLYGARRCTRQS